MKMPDQFSDSKPAAAVMTSTSSLASTPVPGGASGTGASTVAAPGLAVEAVQQHEANQRLAHLAAAASSTSMNDKVLQLMLNQHQQWISSYSTSAYDSKEATLQLLFEQKLLAEQCQQKMTEELRVLQLKIGLVDTMIAKEAGAPRPGGGADLPSSLSSGLGLGSSASQEPPFLTFQQLAQLMQLQGLLPSQPFGATPASNADALGVPPSSVVQMQGLLDRINQQSSSRPFQLQSLSQAGASQGPSAPSPSAGAPLPLSIFSIVTELLSRINQQSSSAVPAGFSNTPATPQAQQAIAFLLQQSTATNGVDNPSNQTPGATAFGSPPPDAPASS